MIRESDKREEKAGLWGGGEADERKKAGNCGVHDRDARGEGKKISVFDKFWETNKFSYST